MATRAVSSVCLVLLLTSALFVSIFSVAGPPQAHAATLIVTLTPNSGKSGDVIIVGATGATALAGTVCSITDDAPAHNLVTSATATVSSFGNVVGSFIVGNAPGALAGYAVIVKCGGTATLPTDSGQAGFVVNPSVKFSPSIGMAGQPISVQGFGFLSTAISCTVINAPSVGTPTCSISGGSVTGSFTVDSISATGAYTITVTPNAGNSGSGVFQKVASPTIALSPISATPGYGTLDGAVSITGGGFASGSARSCTLSLTAGSGLFASTPATTCSISTSGTVTGSFAVATTAPVGPGYIVRVTDTNPAGAFADSPAFTVLSAPALNAPVPPTGPPGTLVSLTAALPFAIQDVGPCTITSSPGGLVSSQACVINAAGFLPPVNFIVSSSAGGGVYTVTVTGLHGDSASTAFTVTVGPLTLSPTSGSPPLGALPGTEVTITGAGFKPSGACTIAVFPLPPAGFKLVIDSPTCTVSSSGVLTNTKFKVGAGSTWGLAYSVTVTGPGADSAAAFLAVSPRIVLSPNSGSTGTKISFEGSGFSQNAGGCSLTTPVFGAPAACTQAADGTLSGYFTVAAVPSGSYFVTVNDVAGASISATAPFTLTGGPIVTLTPNHGPTGSTVTVTGSGFNTADTSVSFANAGLFDGTKTCPVAGGNIASGCTFTVKSNALGGIWGITFTGTQGDTAVAQFMVEATFVMTPENGGRGTTVTMSGSGYASGFVPFNCWTSGLSFSPQPFEAGGGTCMVDASGVLTGSFTVANTAGAGVHTGMIAGVWVPQGLVSDTFTVTTPTISLSPSSGSGGDTIRVSGSGFSSADAGCTIAAPANVIEGTPTCSISGGVVTGSFIIKGPNNPAAVLTNAIQVTGSLGDSAVNTLTVVPKITLTPSSSVSVGSVVTISGTNFRTPGGCSIASSPPGGAGAPWGCTVNADFTVTGSFTVPAAAVGPYTITVADSVAPPASASAQLTVAPRVVILTPSFGPQGTVVTVSGSGFSPTDTGCASLVSVPPGVPTATTCSITNGVLSGSFTVGAVPAQSYAIVVTGNTLSDTGTAAFVVTPSLTIAPSSGRPGTLVTVLGGNWPAGDNGPCTITSSPGGLISSPTCTIAGGAVAGGFTVASGATGPYTVIVTGAAGTEAFAEFNAPEAPTLTLDPTAGPGGQLVTVSGLNYQGSTCLLSSNPGGLFNSPSCAISGGTLTGSFTVASGASPGTAYTVTATTNIGPGDSASATFTVSAGPLGTLTLTPTSGQVGTIVSGLATGFTTDTTCQLTATPAVILSSASCSITGAGNANVGFTVAASTPAGSYTILVVGNTGKSASATFTVLAGPQTTFTLNPTSGPVGTVVSISGSSYAGTTCTLSATPSSLFSSSSCAISSGSLSGGFTVASGASLGYTVTVTTSAGESKAAPFTVTTGPAPTLNPTSGAPGTSIQVSGSGYHGTTCTLTSAPPGLFSSSSCLLSSGALTGSFTIASGASGSYTVILSTDAGETATTPFTVRFAATFTLTPTSGSPGTAVTASGLNYQGNSCTLSSSPSGLLSSPSCSISSGTLTGGFTVASGASGGSYTVTVTTNAAETASESFIVGLTPTLTLSPTSGKGGDVVSVSGLNYQGTSCTISGGNVFTSASCAISNGKLTGSFSVFPGAAAGGYTITVTTNKGETASAAFTVTKPACIIATATFGSEASPAVQFLRNFRDNLALSTKAGSAFMAAFNAWYYSFSPTVASYIAANDPVRAPIRVILYPLLGVLGLSTLTYSVFSGAPEFAIVVAGLVASSLIGLVYLTPFAYIGMRTLMRKRRIQTTSLAKGSLALLATALALLVAGEALGSFLMLAVASSAIVLTCIIALPTITAVALLRAKPE